jgi:hypothetical protein
MVKGERMTKIQVQVRNWVGFILAKPFEWIMRLSFAIHLKLDGNSLWYCMNQDELDVMLKDLIEYSDFCDDCKETDI